ncbi:hypothetical protein B0H12DRAFT_1153560, partial [Mycena haematopus]
TGQYCHETSGSPPTADIDDHDQPYRSHPISIKALFIRWVGHSPFLWLDLVDEWRASTHLDS